MRGNPPLKKRLCSLLLYAGLAGTAHADATGIEQLVISCTQAIQKLLPLAKGGNTNAQFALGHAHSSQLPYCEGLPRDWKEATPWYLKAARQGHVEAQSELASLYRNGWGVSQDAREALKWYRKAAAQNHRASMALLATFYRDGDIVDRDRVLYYMFTAMGNCGKEWNGSANVADMLAHMENKMSPAQVAEAKRLIQKWKVGTPLPTVTKTGLTHPLMWFEKDAEAGNLDAQYRAGLMYKEGDHYSGMREDDSKAVFWLRKAAERGHGDAQYQLGVMHEQVRGVPPDAVIAFMLWSLSANGGNDSARYKRDNLARILTDEQRAEATALLAAWTVGTPLPTQTKTGVRPQTAATTTHTD